jgi:hypothetical protein
LLFYSTRTFALVQLAIPFTLAFCQVPKQGKSNHWALLIAPKQGFLIPEHRRVKIRPVKVKRKRGGDLLESNSRVVNFQGKGFNLSCLLVYQLMDVWGGATDMGT